MKLTFTFTEEQYDAIATALAEGKAVMTAGLRDAQRDGRSASADLLTQWLANAEQATSALVNGKVGFK